MNKNFKNSAKRILAAILASLTLMTAAVPAVQASAAVTEPQLTASYDAKSPFILQKDGEVFINSETFGSVMTLKEYVQLLNEIIEMSGQKKGVDMAAGIAKEDSGSAQVEAWIRTDRSADLMGTCLSARMR